MIDIVERLREKIIVDAFARGSISDGALCDRLIRERLDAADEISRLRAENERLREALKPFADEWDKICNDAKALHGEDIKPDTFNAYFVLVDFDLLRAAKAALGETK